MIYPHPVTKKLEKPLAKRKKSGRPSNNSNEISDIGYPSASYSNYYCKPPVAVTVCGYCLTALAQGKTHCCTKGMRNENILSLTNLGSPKSGQKIAAAILKDTVSLDTNYLLPTSSGKPIPIIVSPQKKDVTPLFSSEQMSQMQVDMNLSSRNTLKLAQNIRTATKNRFSIGRNFKHKLTFINHRLDEYFDVKTVDFVATDPANKKKPY